MNIQRWTTEAVLMERGEKRIFFLFHEEEENLWAKFVPHLNMLFFRLNESDYHRTAMFCPEYYVIRSQQSTTEKARKEQEQFIQGLEEAVIFCPCTSISLAHDLWEMTTFDPQLSANMNIPYTIAIPFRSVHAISSPINSQPFITFKDLNEGAALIITTLEEKLLQYVPASSIRAEKTNKFALRSLIQA